MPIMFATPPPLESFIGSAMREIEAAATPESDAVMAETLRVAADKLEHDGWCQRKEVDREGHICAQQAIVMVAPLIAQTRSYVETREFCGFRRTLAEIVSLRFGAFVGTYSVPTWNDANGRTVDEVTTSMRKFADHLSPPK